MSACVPATPEVRAGGGSRPRFTKRNIHEHRTAGSIISSRTESDCARCVFKAWSANLAAAVYKLLPLLLSRPENPLGSFVLLHSVSPITVHIVLTGKDYLLPARLVCEKRSTIHEYPLSARKKKSSGFCYSSLLSVTRCISPTSPDIKKYLRKPYNPLCLRE